MKRSTATVDCPKSMVGRVIGKNGETIKALQTYSGALIQIDQTCDPTKVTISGTPHSLNMAVSMVSDIVQGTFKGFALLRQLGHPLDPRQPTVPAPRPVYAPGYGLIPANQLYGAEMPGGGGAAEVGERAGLVQMGWAQAPLPHAMMMPAQAGAMLMRPGMAGGGMVAMGQGMPGVGGRPEDQGLMGYAAAVPMGGYMYPTDQLSRMPGGDVGYGMAPAAGGGVGSTARMYGAAAAASAAAGPRPQLASRGQWAGGPGYSPAELAGGVPMGGGGVMGPPGGGGGGGRLVPMMDASGAMFYMEQPGGGPA